MASEEPDSAAAADAALALDALLDDAQREMERGLSDAETKATAALKAARTQESASHEGQALHLRGWARFGTGDMLGALDDQLTAVEVLTSCGDEWGLGRAMHALGSIYDTIGEPAVALEHYEHAIQLQIRTGDTWGEARTRNGFAIAMAQGEQYEEAAQAFAEVADRFAEAGDDWWVLMARVNRAITLLEQMQAGEVPPDEAESLARELLDECDDVISRAASLDQSGLSAELYARHCRAGLLYELGDYAGSLGEANLALPKSTRAGDATLIVDMEMHAARAEEALGLPEAVLERLDRAEELARTAGRDRHLTRCLQLRADICEERGDLVGALAAHRQFHEQKTRARQQAEDMRAKVIRSLLDTQRAEHDLALAKTEVENLEAMGRERRRMVSVIAHELRNPITTVLGLSSEMVENWDELGTDGQGLIGIIRDEAEDLAEIVEDLLAVESLDQGSLHVQPAECELGPMVAAVLSRIDMNTKKATSVGAACAYVDPVRFRQILRNLVTNAVRYGGDRISVVLTEDESVVSVEVRDNGPGVAEGDRESIFEPYRRSGNDGHGTKSVGLGLAVTRQLARLMGGDVVYDSADETVFRLTLPASQSAAAMPS